MPLSSRLACVVWLCFVAPLLAAQGVPQVSGSVLPLYRELRTVGLDPKMVFKIREADIDRQDVHITLNDGTIAFTKSVDGRITGAYFEGDAEVLVRPPDRMERASLGLFTGAGVLEEKFTSAYFRFNDDTAKDLQPFLRPAEVGDFISRNESHARELAAMDGLRLSISFTSLAPTASPGQASTLADKLLHARVAGEHYGVFDIYFDTLSPEQIVVGKTTSEGQTVYYDLWMSFVMSSLRKSEGASARFSAPGGPTWTHDVLVASKYSISGELAPPRDFSAETTVSAQVVKGGSRIVLFELSRYLHLQEVDLDGSPIEFIQNEAIEGSELARRGNDVVAVVFPAPLEAGARVSLRFKYAGSVLSDAGGGLLYVGARGIWYPNLGIAMTNYDETFRFPQAWTLVATGKLVSMELDGGERVGHWISEQPIPVAGFNLGRYSQSSVNAGNVVVNSYAAHKMENQPTSVAESQDKPATSPRSTEGSRSIATPSISANVGQRLAEQAAATLDAYQQFLGPYPFSTLEITQRPGGDSQGWPGLIFLSSYVYLTPAELESLKVSAADRLVFQKLMMPHELGHQWFGDKVSWASYHEQWMLEAFANYCALLLLERSEPAVAQTILQNYRYALAQKSKEGQSVVEAGPVTLGARLSSSKFPNGYEYITYARGTWLMHMLRTMLRDASRSQQNPNGDDTAFLTLLRHIVDEYQGKEITNADFQRAVEQVLPKTAWFENRQSLDWFFDGWVNGTAFPKFDLEGVKAAKRADGLLDISATLVQKNGPSDLVTSLPIYGVAGDRRTYLGRVFAEGDETHFTLQAPAEVKNLLIDPYQTVLTAP